MVSLCLHSSCTMEMYLLARLNTLKSIAKGMLEPLQRGIIAIHEEDYIYGWLVAVSC